MRKDHILALDVFSKKFKALKRTTELFKVNEGWIRYIRTLLGMSSRQLAKRLDVTPPSISMAENQEIEGAVTLKRMQKFADALECDFVYGFIPRKDIKELIQERATQKATEILNKSMIMMELEDQSVELLKENKKQLNKMIEMIKNDKYLWD